MMALLSELVHCASLCIVRVCAQYCQRFGPWYFHSSHDNMMTNRKKWSCSVCWKTCGGGQRSGMYRRAAKWHLVTLDAALQQSQRANRVYSVQIARLILIQMRMRVMTMMVVVWWFEDISECFKNRFDYCICPCVHLCPLAFRERGTDVVGLAFPNRFNRCPDRCHQEHLSFLWGSGSCAKTDGRCTKGKHEELDGWRLEGLGYVVSTL